MTVRGLRILLVEDNQLLRRLFASTLAFLGHEVDARGGVADALRALAGPPFDVAIIDVHLADGSGVSLASTLRALSAERRPHVIATSGKDLDSEQLALFDGFLPKPASEEEIAAQLARVSRRACGA